MRRRYLKRTDLRRARELFLSRSPRGPLRTESVPTEDARRRITAAAVAARLSAPHYHGAAMDGIALRAEDTFGATEFAPVVLEPGAGEPRSFAFVDTGAALPSWTNAVVMIERVVRMEGGRVEIREAAQPWQHVRLVGEDLVTSETILPRGHRIRPADVGALLAAGVDRVLVADPPRIGILPTGSELVEPGEPPQPGRIIEFNSRMLAAYLAEWGAEPVRLAAVPDEPETIERAVLEALRTLDALLVIAGSSAGERDFTVDVVQRTGELLVHGIDVMPGKPAILAIASGKPLVGIPGYPVSAAVIAHEIVRPLVARLLAAPAGELERARAIVPRKIPSRLGLEEIVRVTLGRVGTELVATPLGRGAGVIHTMVRADGLLRIPARLEGLNAGERVEVELLRPLAEIERSILVTGSHDLSLSVLEDCLRREDPGIRLSAANVGSIGGLVALGRGEAHVAGTHLLDPASGTYNVADVRRLLPDRAPRIVNLVRREQGLIVASGNPRSIRGIEDLARSDVRFVNRQPGAGTRVLLDSRLAKLGIDAGAIRGYGREEVTHMAVAIAVRSGLADVGLGIRQAAAALGLDFVPIETEDYDLVMLDDFAASPAGRLLLDTVRSPAFAQAVSSLAGYDTTLTGTEKSLTAS